MVLDIEGFRKAGYAAVDSICEYYQNLEKRPVNAQVEPGFLSKSIPDHAPEKGEEWDTIAKDYQDVILPGITHWQHPNFYAYYPCNATFEGALADLHSAMISNPAFNWSCSPSVTELEIIQLDWLAKALGLSKDFESTSSSRNGGGIILGSASEVALTVTIAAREKVLAYLNEREQQNLTSKVIPPSETSESSLDPDNVLLEIDSKSQIEATMSEEDKASKWRAEKTGKLIMYGTTQTHSIGTKAALILGLKFRALEVKAKDGYALRGETLKKALEEDEKIGNVPFFLIGTLGTTSSGAVDDITEIASIVKHHPTLWLHIDAAYAGVALSIPELRASSHLDAINEVADSFSTNLHKWGLVQFDCSPLHVRDRGTLSRALTITPEYLRTRHGDAGSVLDLRNLQISLGRRFRSLKMWFVLRSYGLEGFRNHLKKSISLSNHFEKLLRTSSEMFEIVAPPRWALVVFRLNPGTGKLGKFKDLEELNQRFWSNLQLRSEEIALTQTVLPEIGFCIRLVVGSPQTEARHIEGAWEVIVERGRFTLAEE